MDPGQRLKHRGRCFCSYPLKDVGIVRLQKKEKDGFYPTQLNVTGGTGRKENGLPFIEARWQKNTTS